MLSQTFVLGFLFFTGVQSQLWDFRPLESREEQNPFNFWPFYPQFSLYSPQPWWKGPNVCVERNEIVTDAKNETREEVETLDDVTNIFQASLSFSHCFETSAKYECMTKIHLHGEDKTFSTRYKCCHGFSRSRLTGQCTQQAELKPLLDLIDDLNGTNFKRLISSVGLTEKLTNENYTVFMPVDEALDESANAISDMNKVEAFRKRRDVSSDSVTDLVLNHLAPGFIDLNDYTNEDLVDSEKSSKSLRFNFYPKPRSGRLATVNCARIIKANNFATNGIVHVIDRSLETPSQDIRNMIDTNPRLTFLRKVLGAITLDMDLSEDRHYTIFAPTDDAFQKIDPATQEKLLKGHACARSIIKHHIAPHTVCSSAIIENATVHNIEGELLNMERKGEDEVYIDGNARITEVDKIATNGVLHLIDRVLVPSSALPIDEVLSQNNVTKFQNLIEEAGLKQEFDSFDNVTIFVPFNEAFEDPETVKYLDEIRNDQSKLRDLVLFHVANKKMESDDMDTSSILETKLSGKFLRLKVHSLFGSLFGTPLLAPLIQCAALTKFEEKSCGSVIHEIDRLLIPPTKSIYEMLESDPKYSTLRSLLEGTEVEEKLKDPSQNLTLLAPSNYAFGRYRYDLDTLRQNKTLANVVLKRHVMIKPRCCQDLNYSDSVFNRWSTFTDPFQSVNARMITECDKIATNGILHTINLFMSKHE